MFKIPHVKDEII